MPPSGISYQEVEEIGSPEIQHKFFQFWSYPYIKLAPRLWPDRSCGIVDSGVK